MKAADTITIVDLLEGNGIEVWLDGGWGVDALLGKQTRTHRDLDIAVQHRDVAKLRELLGAQGYREVLREDTKDWNFVLGDDQGHEVDVHSYAFDSEGKHVYGIEYPADSLTGFGSVNGRPVKCVAAEHRVRFRADYELRETDMHDVLALLPGAIRALRPVGRRTAIVAVDGYGGSGKSTLARRIVAAIPKGTVIRTDDFSKPGIPGWDWQRMKKQVLDPINRDQPGRYPPHDWGKDRQAEWYDVPVDGTLIVEGVSSMRTELGRYWDLAVWVTCSHAVRLARGIARDGEGKRSQWENVWIPEEDAYVASQHPELRADVVINSEKPFAP